MENSQLSTRTHTLLVALISYLTFPAAFFIRFVLMDGYISYTQIYYHVMGVISALMHYVIYSLIFNNKMDFSRRFGKQVQRTIACESIGFMITLASLYLAELANISRMAVFFSYALNVLLISLKHRIYINWIRSVRRSGQLHRRILLVGEGSTALRYAQTVLTQPEAGHRLVGYVASEEQPFGGEYLGGYDALEEALASSMPDEAIIALSAKEYIHIDHIIDVCEHHGVPLRIIPCYEERVSSSVSPSVFEGIKMIGIRDIPLNGLYNALIKRMMDVVISLLMLIILSPLMLFTAIGVKLSTHDTVFFRQVRVGKDKKPFEMLKFRSMRKNDGEQTAWSRNQDDRRTFFGAIIRKLSIDELPQLINVLRGDMSLVGPRPEIPCYVEQFRDEVPLYMIRHMVKPGMTGLAQINGCRGDTSIDERIRHDIYYIEHWTIWMDLRILLGTLTAVVNDEKIPGIRSED
ncbi:MAG: exopolysaccharide biosynthesis polyprenyl glycosylphosphotransferase [Clostridia bacterium]|nr:exopolysaccharide biosynthesis polyprenyl glycosylphosphotransferase [Clostridia bacterium]